MLTMWLRNVLTISESLVWDRRFGWFLVVINSVSSRESTCNIAACTATSSPSSPGYYAPPLSTPLIPRRRHERSTAPPLPPSTMPSVFLDIKAGMPTVSQLAVLPFSPHTLLISLHIYYFAPDRAAEYCDDRVCLSVCLSVREHISGTTHPSFTRFLCKCYLCQWLGPPLAA